MNSICHFPFLTMYDMFDNEFFIEAVQETFSVLAPSYVEDLCKELLPRLNATFDQLFETKFLIIDNATGKPVSKEAVTDQRATADELCRMVGSDRHSVAILLIEQ